MINSPSSETAMSMFRGYPMINHWFTQLLTLNHEKNSKSTWIWTIHDAFLIFPRSPCIFHIFVWLKSALCFGNSSNIYQLWRYSRLQEQRLWADAFYLSLDLLPALHRASSSSRLLFEFQPLVFTRTNLVFESACIGVQQISVEC